MRLVKGKDKESKMGPQFLLEKMVMLSLEMRQESKIQELFSGN